MNWNTPGLTSRTRHLVRVEHEGFFNGAHEVGLRNGLDELEAYFNQKKAEMEQRFIKLIRRIEGRLEFVKKIAPEVLSEWNSIRERIGEEKPHVAVPLIIVTFGLFSIVAETGMLAPSLDMLGVADPTWQDFAAFGLCAMAAVIFHLAWNTFEAQRLSKLWKIAWRFIAVLAVPALAAWGVLRGYQVAFASELAQNPLANFLHGHPVLASIFYVFITLATPIAAAGSLHFTSTHLHDWYEYTTCKRKAYAVHGQLSGLSKQLQEQTESRDKALMALEEEKNRFKASYSLHHERGQKRLAKQMPFWVVLFKALAAALFTVILEWHLLFLYPAIVLLPIAVFLLIFLYFHHLREHPTPSQYYDHEFVRFADPGDKESHS